MARFPQSVVLNLLFVALCTSRMPGLAQNPKEDHWNVNKISTIPGLEHGTFESTAAHATVGYTVWLPPTDSSNGQPLPVIYFLHGAGGDEYAGTSAIIPRVREAIEQKQLPPILCVFCNSDHSGYRDDESTGILGESQIVSELWPSWQRGSNRKIHTTIATLFKVSSAASSRAMSLAAMGSSI